ncbi:hypothetical protein CLOM_g3799 [Closterium sp. NIES-68]|nr:hypothetical protein CLOM_g3799 [Closterium sp. NIES-68]GJP79820.1 hypothetical protein CLOP_g10030 [Closterium sp. NIES-67]
MDRYVYTADPEFRWEDTGNRMREKESGGWWTGYWLKVTTHAWLNRTVTNRYKWWHWLALIAPDNMHNAHKGLVLFFVGAGLNPVNQVHIPGADEIFIRLAAPMVVELGILGVMLQQVPVMPITFHVGPPGIGARARLEEEEITAHTIAMFLDHPDEWEWLTPLPMAKSIIRALDASQLAARELLPHVPVEGFVAVGVSKRAGMSYIAAALDKRVVAFMTYGYDLLNVVPNLQHMHDSLGGWPILLKFNSEYNISQRLHSKEYRKLADMIDPYSFIARMDMPKLLISASNDEFFLIDDTYYFLKDMPQPTQVKIVPNLYHMAIQNSFWAYDACLSFFASLLEVNSSCASLPASSRPALTWTRPNIPSSSSSSSSSSSNSSSSTSSSSPSSLKAVAVEGTGLFAQEGAGEAGARGPEGAQPKLLPWSCSPKLPAVSWPNLRWRFDWSTFTIHATSERKPLAVRAWTARTFKGSKRRDFRMVIKQGQTGCVAPFQMPPSTYAGKFGMLCAQPIPFVTAPVSKPMAEDDGLWHFKAIMTDIPKDGGYRAMFIEADYNHPPFKKPFTITTEAMVAPNNLPFSECTKPECYFNFV